MPYPSGDSSVVNASLWKPLRLFNFYRLGIAGLFLIIILSTGPELLGKHDAHLFVAANALYVFLSLALSVSGYYRWPDFELQVYAQALIDICAITLLVYASGGVGSGLGMLMIAAVAGAGLLTRGRLALGVAAFGALALLCAEVYADLHHNFTNTSYTQTGLLGASLFLTAWLALTLARRARESEALAARRGIDLANLAELNSLIVNRMQSGIVVVDDGGQVRLMNQTARALLGGPAAGDPPRLEALSHPLYRLFQKWLPSQDNHAQPQRLTHGLTSALQARFTRVGARREDRGAVIYIEDTAEINRQIQETKLASLSRLTASIAHEIRNPLGAISHAAQLLGESPKLDAADQRMVGMIQEQSKRMNAIIQDVLRLYRKEQPKTEALALKPWIERFNAQFSRDHKLAPAWAAIEIRPADTCIQIDPNHLHQVMWNLCVNALKYGRDACGAPGVRLIGGLPPDDAAAPYLDVIDRGPGIAPELQAQLFEPFMTSSAQGTGLGLFIARELAQANGGDLSFRPNPAGGSCFRIQFPLADRQLPVMPADDPQPEELAVATRAHR
jgi:two-component system, NtrC family, sensor histidine kinase PilS